MMLAITIGVAIYATLATLYALQAAGYRWYQDRIDRLQRANRRLRIERDSARSHNETSNALHTDFAKFNLKHNSAAPYDWRKVTYL